MPRVPFTPQEGKFVTELVFLHIVRRNEPELGSVLRDKFLRELADINAFPPVYGQLADWSQYLLAAEQRGHIRDDGRGYKLTDAGERQLEALRQRAQNLNIAIPA